MTGSTVQSVTSARVPSSVRVRRTKGGWRDRGRAYRIEVDGAEVGRLRRGQELVVDVAPGEHRVCARIDWTGSEAISVQVAPGATASVAVSPKNGSSWRGLLGTFSGPSWVNIAED